MIRTSFWKTESRKQGFVKPDRDNRGTMKPDRFVVTVNFCLREGDLYHKPWALFHGRAQHPASKAGRYCSAKDFRCSAVPVNFRTIMRVRDNDVEVRKKRNRVMVFRLAIEAVPQLDSRSVDY
jgi:hypothetical protein